jgi:hypothetical protein
MTKTQRYALIRKVAKKIDRENRKVRRSAAMIRKHRERLDDRSVLYWSDASNYAKEYYGEIARETTRFDGDWN